MSKRLTTEDYHAIAAKRGFEWLGPGVLNNRTKTVWRCKLGHEWNAPYSDLQCGQGCPRCGKINGTEKRRLSVEQYHALAKSNGFEWIGDERPSSTITRTTWKCPRGHIFEARYNDIQFGHGCTQCLGMINGRYVSKTQLRLHELTGGEVNRFVGRYCVDIALEIDQVKIAIEYDAWYWHRNRQEKDAKRDRYLMDQGWLLLRVKSMNSLPSIEQLNTSISILLSGERYIEIVLDDWRGERGA